MIRPCEDCWTSYDTEREGAGEFFCPKCNIIKCGGLGDGMEKNY